MDPVSLIPLPDYIAALALKGGLALLATALLCWHWWADRRGHRKAWIRNTLLILVSLSSGAGWWNWGGLHFGGGYVHYHEFFHYYLGSKYFPELGYTGLYDCVVAAEVEAGRGAEIMSRWTRDLVTNELQRGSPVVASPDICRVRFSNPSRWQDFKRDVATFHELLNRQKWSEILSDHGYNATPVWTIAGSLLTNLSPASRERNVRLALIDPALLIVMWGLVWWAFGWRVMCVGMVWWGTNYPARFTYTGGAFLRQDWLFMAVASVCFARRGWSAASGFTLVWATLLRIFPAFIGIGLVFKALMEMWRVKSVRLPGEYWRFAAGAALALVILLPLSFTVAGGPEGGGGTWRAFVQNSRKHVATPLTNNVGLPMVVSFDPGTRSANISNLWLDTPWDMWKAARSQMFEDRRWIYVTIVCAYFVLLAAAVREQPLWMALVLSAGAIPFLTNLSCYYYSFLLVFAALSPRYPIAGIGLTALSAATCAIPALMRIDDDRYTVVGLVILIYVVCATALVALKPQIAGEAAVSRTRGLTADTTITPAAARP